MYASLEKIREYLENDPKKPFLLCEYMGGIDIWRTDVEEAYHVDSGKDQRLTFRVWLKD